MQIKEQDMTLEEAFAELDSIVEKMEEEQNSLEDSFQTYKKGMELLQYCNEQIDMVEKKMLILNEDGELDEFEF